MKLRKEDRLVMKYIPMIFLLCLLLLLAISLLLSFRVAHHSIFNGGQSICKDNDKIIFAYINVSIILAPTSCY